MKEKAFIALSLLAMILLFFCATSYAILCEALSGPECASSDSESAGITWFPVINITILASSPNVDFLPGLKCYQQTTDYTCGPSALISLAKFYGMPGIEENTATEIRIAKELGTRDLSSSKPGTTPQEMVVWLQKNGFDTKLQFEDQGDGSALQQLRDNLRQGMPTLVEWIDLGGHWAVAVGYDYRNVSDPWDDILILADPYDRYDDYQDGYSFVNANRFYWMWFDYLYFENITWRTMITATPRKPFLRRPSL